ncbi:MAG: low specificity L-threonine aldolase [Stappia sp.]|uniref:threonine aldolase family protein n=1 Tax=Stappia sp. TaxID=1870903 RepID=UPI000C4302AD|nr:low specificity L-threonine aldolase [Stappia sp.]MAA98858.1 low specificity L-threonine aldolase [Stappia sp.]MBM21596.1 low specificity L-threonine aldolase [Stappia sp.]
MIFASDNWAGASQPVMDALAANNTDFAAAYGRDPLTDRVTERLGEMFERPVEVYFTATGTAANALSMAACARPGGLVLTSETAHVYCDEWGAAEFFTHGMKMVPLPTVAGKITPDGVAGVLDANPEGSRFGRPVALSLTQASECGTVYTPEEVRALTGIAASRDLVCHMDGARFANALVSLGATPAEVTWKAGIDVLSFGGTKNGCWCAEAVVVFNPDRLPDLVTHRSRSGHLFSKSRFVAAQFDGYLANDHWRELATHANAMATRLGEGLAAAGHRLAYPVEANEVFPVLDLATIARLREAGAAFYEWPEVEAGEDTSCVRLVTSFATKSEEVARFLEIAAR